MLMGHPPPIIARGREHVPHGCFEGLTPVQVSMVMEELVACDAQVQETLADPLEVVQEIPQAGPHTFHRITVHTRAVRVTPRILTRTMVDCSMIIALQRHLSALQNLPLQNGGFAGASDQGHEFLKCPQLVVLQSMFI